MSSVINNTRTIAADQTLTVKEIQAKPNNVLDTSGAVVTVTLPANPVEGLEVYFRREGAGNNGVIGRNGNTINGAASDLTLGTNLQFVELFYTGGDWKSKAAN